VSRIDILTPATITVFADNSALVTLSSLDSLPPYGIDITDPSGGTFGQYAGQPDRERGGWGSRLAKPQHADGDR
jgi:hypothetical protein